ncbi:MAG: glycerate kinase type-2 family protein [Bacteroidota bacterium]
MNHDQVVREAREIFNAAIEAVRPASIFRFEDVRNRIVRLSANHARLFVLGFGKAGAAMASAVEHLVGSRLQDSAVVVPRSYLEKLPPDIRPRHIQLLPGGHPTPTEDSIRAARRIMAVAHRAAEGDAVLVLISGGGSALFSDFPEGIELSDARRTYELLLASGASIHEVNSVRKHISSVSGGRLAAAVYPARCVSLVISDVPRDDPSVIASGPTIGDASTYDDAANVLEKYQLFERLPASVRHHIVAGRAGRHPESVKPDDARLDRMEWHLIAHNGTALDAAARAAEKRGYRVARLSPHLEGDARSAGFDIASDVAEADVQVPSCWIWGGETTVSLGDFSGKGGRNQELAAAAALELNCVDGRGALLSGGTDGYDGPTDAAGAVVTPETARKAAEMKLDINRALDKHDVYSVLDQLGCLVRTGPTHTNVMDIVVALRRP